MTNVPRFPIQYAPARLRDYYAAQARPTAGPGLSLAFWLRLATRFLRGDDRHDLGREGPHRDRLLLASFRTGVQGLRGVARVSSEGAKPRHLAKLLRVGVPVVLEGLHKHSRVGDDMVRRLSVDGTARRVRRAAGSLSPFKAVDNGKLIAAHQGRRKVTLVEPRGSEWMYARLHDDGREVRGLSPVDTRTALEHPARYPLFQYVTRYEVTLEPGDVLYVPAWWWHESLDLTRGELTVAQALARPRAGWRVAGFAALRAARGFAPKSALPAASQTRTHMMLPGKV